MKPKLTPLGKPGTLFLRELVDVRRPAGSNKAVLVIGHGHPKALDSTIGKWILDTLGREYVDGLPIEITLTIPRARG